MGRIREILSQLTVYQKVSAILLAFFGVTAVFLAGLQMRTRILDGGETRRTQASSVYADLAAAGNAAATVLGQDTDKDGLTDTDEIKTYHTSPYLQDSDSDGKTDGEEIAAGTNPNCPEGETCFGLGNSTSVDRPSTDSSEVKTQQPTSPIQGVSGSNGTVSIPAFDAEAVRKALRDSGVPEAQVEAVTDEELRKMYEDTVREAQKKSSPTGTSGSNTNSATVSTEIVIQARAILVQSGVSQAQVDAMSDEEILQLLTAAAAKNER